MIHLTQKNSAGILARPIKGGPRIKLQIITPEYWRQKINLLHYILLSMLQSARNEITQQKFPPAFRAQEARDKQLTDEISKFFLRQAATPPSFSAEGQKRKKRKHWVFYPGWRWGLPRPTTFLPFLKQVPLDKGQCCSLLMKDDPFKHTKKKAEEQEVSRSLTRTREVQFAEWQGGPSLKKPAHPVCTHPFQTWKFSRLSAQSELLKRS